MDGKICPISNTFASSCWGKECGWWDKIAECCAIVTLGNSMASLAEVSTNQKVIYTKEV